MEKIQQMNFSSESISTESIDKKDDKLGVIKDSLSNLITKTWILNDQDLDKKIFRFVKNKEDKKEITTCLENIINSKEVISEGINDEKMKAESLELLNELLALPVPSEKLRDDFYDFAKTIVIENIDKIIDEIESQRTTVNKQLAMQLTELCLSKESFRLHKYLEIDISEEYRHDDKEQKQELKTNPKTKDFYYFVDILEKSKEKIRENVDKGLEVIEDNPNSIIEYSAYFRIYLRYLKPDKEFDETISKIQDKLRGDFISHDIALSVLKNRGAYTQERTEEMLLDCVLGEYGFSVHQVTDLIKSWVTIYTKKDAYLRPVHGQTSFVKENLLTIKDIEKKCKGSALYLFENFGIKCFSRYSSEELLKQYNQREEQGSYGVFVRAISDWNGSLSKGRVSEILREKIERNGLMMRIIETDSQINLARRLLSLKGKYNQKIKFLYMDAHGNEESILLGDSDKDIDKDDLGNTSLQKAKKIFVDDAEIVLASCSTGVKNGFAENLAKIYNLKVIASDDKIEGDPWYVDVKKNDEQNNVNFEIVFHTSGDKKRSKGTVIFDPEK